MVISDEVWEHILLDDQRFTTLLSLPGMAERTIKIGSAGKIFSLTGWKVGWMIAAPELANVVARAHQFLTFATAPNLQSAVAYGLSDGDAWLEPMRHRFTRARDRMIEGLRGSGYKVLHPASTYFLCVDLAASGVRQDGESFSTAAVERAGGTMVPLSAFSGTTRQGTSSASASERRMRRSTLEWLRWPRPRRCSHHSRRRSSADPDLAGVASAGRLASYSPIDGSHLGE